MRQRSDRAWSQSFSGKHRLQIEALEDRRLLAVLTDGPLVGAVSDHNARVFVRTDVAAAVQVEFSQSSTFAQPQRSGSATTQAGHDFTAILPLVNLAADTRYYYRVLVNGQIQTTASQYSFTTFVPAGQSDNFSFAVVADSSDTLLFPEIAAPVYQQVAADNPAFVMQIGDFDHRNPATLAEMRQMHRDVRGPTSAQGNDFATHIASQFPVFHVYDDHDYGIDDGDKTFARRASALQAFQEYYPTPDLPNPAAGIWHKFADAQVDLFMLDLRSQRDPNIQPDSASKSILEGDNIANGQKPWLKQSLLQSTATWKFIVSTVAFNPTTKPYDSWGAFGTERQEILEFIRSNQVGGVIFISGDLHTGGAIDDGTHSGRPEISVPHTNLNLPPNQQASGIAGSWSEGWISGVNNPGYVLVRIRSDPNQVILEAKGADGAVRKSLTVSLPAPQQGPTTAQVAAAPLIGNTPPTFTANVSDIATGGNAIARAEYFIDRVGPVGSGTVMAAQDGIFNEPAEGVTAKLDSVRYAALPAGTHTVFVRGLDAAGHWGPSWSMQFTKSGTVAPQILLFSTAVGGNLTSSNGSTLAVSDADIVKLVVQSNGQFQHSLQFDGSDVGLTTAAEDIDAFATLADGSIVLSTVGAFSVSTRYSRAGLGSGALLSGQGHDLLRFVTSQVGSTTLGSWSIYLRGNSVDLGGTNENIDAVSVMPDGRIIISTVGPVSVPGLVGDDEDLLSYTPATRAWQMFFDGSDVAPTAAEEDVDAVWIQTPAAAGLPIVHLSTGGSTMGAGEDIFRFKATSLGADTRGAFDAIVLDGSRFGLTALGLDGFALLTMPTSVTIAADDPVLEFLDQPPRLANVSAVAAPGDAVPAANHKYSDNSAVNSPVAVASLSTAATNQPPRDTGSTLSGQMFRRLIRKPLPAVLADIALSTWL